MNEGDFVTRREFDASSKYYDRALSDLSRQAHEDRTGIQEELRRLGEKLEAKPAQQVGSNLAMHAAADALLKVAEQMQQPQQTILPRASWFAPAAGGGSFIGLIAMIVWQVWGPK